MGWLIEAAGRHAAAGAAGTPPPISRDAAQSAAKQELSKRAYHAHDPSTASRVLSWLLRKLSHILDVAAQHSPGNGIGLLVIVVLVAAAIAVVGVRVGRIRRSTKAVQQPILGHEIAAPADHRRRAEAFAIEEQWAQAVREWLRATTRELEERGVLDPRPGRTASEMCDETAARLPALTADLRRATSAFDAIWYGGRKAGPDDEKLLRALDRRVAGSHRALVATAPAGVGQ